jgi:MFS family permease
MSAPDTSPPHAVRPPLFTGRFALLLAVQLSYGFVFSAFLLLPKYLATVHRAGADVIGQLTGAALFASVASVPLMSFLLARINRGTLIVTGALLGAGASAAFALVETPGLAMLALRLLQGVAFVLVFNASGTLVTDLVPRERLGQALGFWGLAMLVTNAIAPALLEPVAARHGWNPVFFVAGAAGLLAAVLGGIVGRRTAPRQASQGARSSPIFEARRCAVFGVSALMGAGLGTMFTFIQPFALKLGIEHISGFFLGYTAAAISARVGFGQLADRLGRARVSAVALSVYASSVLGAAWLSEPLLAVVGAGLGLAHGIAYPALNALAVEDTDARLRGPVMAYYNGAFNLGFAASVATFGEMARAFGYPPIFVLASSLVLGGAALLVWIPARRLQISPAEDPPCARSDSRSTAAPSNGASQPSCPSL